MRNTPNIVYTFCRSFQKSFRLPKITTFLQCLMRSYTVSSIAVRVGEERSALVIASFPIGCPVAQTRWRNSPVCRIDY